jgi:hypothetical protein
MCCHYQSFPSKTSFLAQSFLRPSFWWKTLIVTTHDFVWPSFLGQSFLWPSFWWKTLIVTTHDFVWPPIIKISEPRSNDIVKACCHYQSFPSKTWSKKTLSKKTLTKKTWSNKVMCCQTTSLYYIIASWFWNLYYRGM